MHYQKRLQLNVTYANLEKWIGILLVICFLILLHILTKHDCFLIKYILI